MWQVRVLSRRTGDCCESLQTSCFQNFKPNYIFQCEFLKMTRLNFFYFAHMQTSDILLWPCSLSKKLSLVIFRSNFESSDTANSNHLLYRYSTQGVVLHDGTIVHELCIRLKKNRFSAIFEKDWIINLARNCFVGPLHWLGKIATFRCKLPSNHAKTPSKHRQKNTKPECDFSETLRCFERS